MLKAVREVVPREVDDLTTAVWGGQAIPLLACKSASVERDVRLKVLLNHTVFSGIISISYDMVWYEGYTYDMIAVSYTHLTLPTKA